VWVKEMEEHSTCESKESNKNFLTTENERTHEKEKIGRTAAK
jgi:hypothetical protein